MTVQIDVVVAAPSTVDVVIGDTAIDVTVLEPAIDVTVTQPIIDVTINLGAVDIIETLEVGPRGPAGAAGPTTSIAFDRTASGALSGHRLVSPTVTGAVEYADPTTTVGRPVWLTLTAAIDGDTTTVLALGVADEPSWDWTPQQPIYLAANGTLTQTPPVTGVLLEVAVATAPTSIFFDPKPPIALS
jgi:hypothetical protein